MKKSLVCGLILLVASALPALAWGNGPDEGGGGAFFLSGAGNSHSTQGYLGIDVRDVAPDEVAALKLKDARGAEIVLVDHDAPAGKAGLREHDVVLQMNGQTVEGRDAIRKMLHECAPGKTVVLVISRDGQQMTISTQMSTQEEVERQAWEQHLTDTEAAPADNAGSDFPSPLPAPNARGNSFIGTLLMNPSYTGAMLEEMSIQLADFFGVSSGMGLLVRSVEPDSPAAVAGMRAGDVVVRADAKTVATISDWARAVKNSRGRSLTIVVMRDKKEQTLTLTPDSKKRSELKEPAPTAGASDSVARLGMSWLPRS